MNLLTDLRYAVRLLVKAPGFTLVAILTLALAIGVNVAIFSVVNGLLIRPLPFPEPDRLMQAMRKFPDGRGPSVSLPRFINWRDHNPVFTHMAAFDNLGSGFNLSSDGPPERLVGSRVTRDFLAVLGVKPELGRDFLPEEDRPGARRVVLLSHDLWQRRFGSDRSWVGRQLVLNGESYTVVGIMPEGFRFPARSELWTPVGLDPASEEKANYLEVAGRLKPGATREQAEAALSLLTKRLAAQHPDWLAPGETAAVVPIQERLYGRLRPALLVLLGAVACVLLIACVNVANLQLARAAARHREIAIRAVLGAGSSRIVRQLLVESLVLALAGGAVGLGVAYLGVPALLALSPLPLERMAPIVIDGRVLLYALVLSLGAGVLFGLAPALGAARASLAEPLKEGTNRTTGGGVKGARTRRLLVVSEVALALVLITGAALLVKSFVGIVRTDPGFSPDHVLTVKLSLPEGKYGTGAAIEGLTGQVLERLSGLPGVVAAAAATTLPLEDGPDLPFAIEGRYNGAKGADATGVGEAQYRAITADLLKTLKIGMAAGRGIEAADKSGAPPIVLVNEAAARQFWPKQNPIGQRITIGKPFVPELADPGPRTIVGVVRDVKEAGLDEEAPPILYVPVGQVPPSIAALFVRLLPLSVAVRTAGDPAALTEAVKKAVWAVDPQQPVSGVAPMTEIVTRSLGMRRFNAILLGVLAILALVLAAVGIYGVLSYLVGQRTREIGVRMALGASGGDVLQLVVRQGLLAVLIGVGLGLGGALALTRVLKGLLYGVSPTDPAIFFLAPAVLTAVALFASSVPARRASRLDPVAALAKL